ncbi:hypothetical protein B0T26DRAFT_676209 [Lasiosphaeria miniovina]|uniref:Uncharacterized protein n=1 Tax=Lasiosphaeria miniovina TaxID=1954250 RepID=A0AA40E0B0_9PEZI|nr:uncharacterized protein B0T26DRAFT_676209 [Lasiosphaeria miniovina]KAK0717978.1 hypothetical protein B0T26DRAFT_676209 [Lasiosphaeria miniovina]
MSYLQQIRREPQPLETSAVPFVPFPVRVGGRARADRRRGQRPRKRLRKIDPTPHPPAMADSSLGPVPLDGSNWSLVDIALCGLDAGHHHCGRRDKRGELGGLADSLARRRLGRRYRPAQLCPRPRSSREMVVMATHRSSRVQDLHWRWAASQGVFDAGLSVLFRGPSILAIASFVTLAAINSHLLQRALSV